MKVLQQPADGRAFPPGNAHAKIEIMSPICKMLTFFFHFS